MRRRTRVSFFDKLTPNYLENTIMATEGAIVTKDWEPAARDFVRQASLEQLQQIAAGTTLAGHPLVGDSQATAEQKTEGLRKLIAKEAKRHADFRGMLIRLIARKGFVTAPGKEAKKEPAGGGKEASAGQEGKPKKEKKKSESVSPPAEPGATA
jgi:hypothetical protein